jgi:NAD+ synthase
LVTEPDLLTVSMGTGGPKRAKSELETLNAKPSPHFSSEVLAIDASRVADKIEEAIREIVLHRLRRKGAVIALSGGVDSSVTAALCARALGKGRVLGLLLPESESSHDSLHFAQLLTEALGIPSVVENIGSTLDALGCYQRRDEAIRRVIPEYREGWKSKIVLPNLLDESYYALYSVVAQSPSGETRRTRLTPEAYLGVVAATNFKQRVRKTLEYYHADRLWYAVAGTPNRLEYAQGFFVKNGDGSADFKPIAHLYKTQIYQLGRYLGVPEEILQRPPTTDTYSLDQSQEEFYFALPLEKMDLCLYGKNHGIPAEDVSTAIGLSAEQVKRVYAMIDSKLKASAYLHLLPQLVEPVTEVHDDSATSPPLRRPRSGGGSPVARLSPA